MEMHRWLRPYTQNAVVLSPLTTLASSTILPISQQRSILSSLAAIIEQPAVLSVTHADATRDISLLSNRLWRRHVYGSERRHLDSITQCVEALRSLDAVKESLESIEMEDSMNDADDEYIAQDLLQSLGALWNKIATASPIGIETLFRHLEFQQLLPTLLRVLQSAGSNINDLSAGVSSLILLAFKSDRGLQMLAGYTTQLGVLEQWRIALGSLAVPFDASRLQATLRQASIPLRNPAVLQSADTMALLEVTASLSGCLAIVHASHANNRTDLSFLGRTIDTGARRLVSQTVRDICIADVNVDWTTSNRSH